MCSALGRSQGSLGRDQITLYEKSDTEKEMTLKFKKLRSKDKTIATCKGADINGLIGPSLL